MKEIKIKKAFKTVQETMRITKYLTDLLKSKKINYLQLSSLLNDVGVNETAKNLSNKIKKGTFSFLFVVQVLNAINEDSIKFNIDEINIEFKEDEYLTKDEFISKYLELSLFYFSTQENDTIIKEEIENISIMLLRRIGTSFALFADLESIYKHESLTKEQVTEFYNLVIKKNILLQKVDNFKREIMK